MLSPAQKYAGFMTSRIRCRSMGYLVLDSKIEVVLTSDGQTGNQKLAVGGCGAGDISQQTTFAAPPRQP